MSGYIEATKYYNIEQNSGSGNINNKNTGASSIVVFNENLQTNPNTIGRQEIDIDALSEKYKENPIGVIQELGVDFNEEQQRKLNTMLKDEKHLESFLVIVDKSNLNAEDIMAAMQKTNDFKGNNFFGRVWNVIKTTVKDGISEGVELARSESVYYANELSSTMSEIRTERKDFSAEGLANIADVCVTNPDIKDETMHFVTFEAKKGEYLYSEQDVLGAATFMAEKPDEAETFLANAQELESIKDENGNVKYKGSTIVNVDIRMVNNKELKPTMMKAAHKSDMTDEYLNNITYNLEQNPHMQEAIEFSLDAKNEDGTDRFSACSINYESNHLVDKDQDYCNTFTLNLQELTGYSNLSGEDIVSITANITSAPEIKNEIINMIKSGEYSGKEIAEYSTKLSGNTPITSTADSIDDTADSGTDNLTESYTVTTTPSFTESAESTQNNSAGTDNSYKEKYEEVIKILNNLDKINITMPEESTDIDSDSETGINIAEKHNIHVGIYYKIYNYFGTMTDAILQQIKKDPGFIDVIKECNGNLTILKAQIENPSLVNKIKSAAHVSNKDLEEILKLCTGQSDTNVMLAALNSANSVNQAIKITRKSKINNTEDDALNILDSTKKNASKQLELQELYGIC